MSVKSNTTEKSRGADFWNSNPCGGAWKNYRQFMDWIKQTEPYIFEILDNHQWQDRKVLEVGCGQGTTLNYLPLLGAKVIGLDMSESSIGQARAGAMELGHTGNVAFSTADAENLPIANECFTRVISIGVLHHTPNTAAGVNEIYRVLKPGGRAIVMLYRTGNPKWWMTKALRTASHLMDLIAGRPDVLIQMIRSRQQTNHPGGTALLELFGVPVLNAYSNNDTRRIFSLFREVHISNHQPGFYRLSDLMPILGRINSTLSWVDRRMQAKWGFYQVVEAIK